MLHVFILLRDDSMFAVYIGMLTEYVQEYLGWLAIYCYANEGSPGETPVFSCLRIQNPWIRLTYLLQENKGAHAAGNKAQDFFRDACPPTASRMPIVLDSDEVLSPRFISACLSYESSGAVYAYEEIVFDEERLYLASLRGQYENEKRITAQMPVREILNASEP